MRSDTRANSAGFTAVALLGASGYVRSQGSSIDLYHDILRLHPLQVHHRRFDIPVPHPNLESANIYPVPQVLRGKCVTKFM
jgi:hypothetical protein